MQFYSFSLYLKYQPCSKIKLCTCTNLQYRIQIIGSNQSNMHLDYCRQKFGKYQGSMFIGTMWQSTVEAVAPPTI